MDQLLEELEAWGCNTATALERVLGDRELYGSCFVLFAEDKNFELCADALQKQDYRAAFEAAHALKGVAANLELTPLQKAISTLVEALRSHRPQEDCNAAFCQIETARARLDALLKKEG